MNQDKWALFFIYIMGLATGTWLADGNWFLFFICVIAVAGYQLLLWAVE